MVCDAEMPSRAVLDTALQWQATPRPVPNLGYACLNMALREQKPPLFTNRSAALPPRRQLCLAVSTNLAAGLQQVIPLSMGFCVKITATAGYAGYRSVKHSS